MFRVLLLLLCCLFLSAPLQAEEPYEPDRHGPVDWSRIFKRKGPAVKTNNASSEASAETEPSTGGRVVDWKEVFAKESDARDGASKPLERKAAPAGAEPEPQAELRYELDPRPKKRALVEAKPLPEPEAGASPAPLMPEAAPVKSRSAPKPEPMKESIPKTAEPPKAEKQLRTASIEPRKEEADPAPEPPGPLYHEDLVADFLSMAFFEESEQKAYLKGGPEPRALVLTRWESDLEIMLKGAPTAANKADLQRALSCLNKVLATSDIRLREAESGGSVAIYFMPARRGEEMPGFFQNHYDGPTIVGSEVVLYSGKASYEDLLKQMLHVLGLPGALPEDDGKPAKLCSDLSVSRAKALEMLYRPELEGGMLLGEAKLRLMNLR
jgi:hypothetical protein